MKAISTQEVNAYSLPDSVFYQEVIDRSLGHTRFGTWPTLTTLEEHPNIVAGSIASRVMLDGNVQFVTFEMNGGLVTLKFENDQIYATSAAKTAHEADEILTTLKKMFPEEAEDKNPAFTYINFWSLTARGPSNNRRKIEVPTWDEIQGNYSKSVLPKLERLMVLEGGELFSNGQLVLWQGAPGGGKTYALRALTRQWRDWCDFHYITDPEKFFGSSADYMLQVILSQNAYDPWEDGEDEPQEKWKLLILEDSGELLAADAKEKTGQGLSRLLNVVDGLIGQGLKLIVLVTTNEELDSLHPAVSRPGRAASKITFDSLNREAAKRWLVQRGFDPLDAGVKVSDYNTVAELYAILNGSEA